MPIDLELLRVATAAFNPHTLESGTELMAPFLYSLVRMVRPVTVVELGSGYTTMFVLRALADNASDVEEEARLLDEKTRAILPEHPKSVATVGRETLKQWFAAGEKACGVDPEFYTKPYTPHMFCLEELPADHPYSQAMKRAVADVGHTALFTQTHGAFSESSLPPSIDLAWNDHEAYEEFFTATWPRVKSGGLFVFHNVPADESHWRSIEWMKAQRAPHGDLEVLVLQEPHKLNQNGCAILRKTTDYRPPLALKNPQAILDNLAKFRAR